MKAKVNIPTILLCFCIALVAAPTSGASTSVYQVAKKAALNVFKSESAKDQRDPGTLYRVTATQTINGSGVAIAKCPPDMHAISSGFDADKSLVVTTSMIDQTATQSYAAASGHGILLAEVICAKVNVLGNDGPMNPVVPNG